MREIKFRAWDLDNKKYEYDITIRPNNRLIGIEIFNNEMYPVEFRGTVEQYTGLKDKNGKEIYEGDILQIDDHVLGDFKVVWHNLGWGIKRSVGYETLAVHKSENCTVIGNIHDNPELLEEEK